MSLFIQFWALAVVVNVRFFTPRKPYIHQSRQLDWFFVTSWDPENHVFFNSSGPFRPIIGRCYGNPTQDATLTIPKPENLILVGGFNLFEKYLSKWESSPNRSEHKKIFETITLLRVIPTMTCWVEVVRWRLSGEGCLRTHI